MCLERRFEKTVMTVMAVDAFVLEVMGVRQSQRMMWNWVLFSLWVHGIELRLLGVGANKLTC